MGGGGSGGGARAEGRGGQRGHSCIAAALQCLQLRPSPPPAPRLPPAPALHSGPRSTLVCVCREWYDQEETGGFVDETHNPFLGEEGDPLLKKREESLQARMGSSRMSGPEAITELAAAAGSSSSNSSGEQQLTAPEAHAAAARARTVPGRARSQPLPPRPQRPPPPHRARLPPPRRSGSRGGTARSCRWRSPSARASCSAT